MANEFSDRQEDQTTKRFQLVRVETARYITDDLSAGLNTLTGLPHPTISDVKSDGVSLTEVSGTPSSGEWSYDDAGTLQVYPADHTEDIVIFGYLFFTNEKVRFHPEDPETAVSASNPLREWEPRLVKKTGTRQSIENVVDGKLSTSSSSIGIINTDSFFQDYLTDDDSFNDRGIKSWDCIDSVDNISASSEATTVGIRFGNTVVTLETRDAFQGFSKQALLGDVPEDAFYNKTNFPGIADTTDGIPIPFIFGNVSRYNTAGDGFGITVSGLSTFRNVVPSSMNQAFCTTFSEDVSTSNNRPWGCCRLSSSGTKDLDFTASAISNSANYVRFTVPTAKAAIIKVGDTTEFTESAPVPGTRYYLRVVEVDTVNDYVYCVGTTTATAGSGTFKKIPTVVIEDTSTGSKYFMNENDYSAVETALPSGNYYYGVTFINNFEASHAGLGALDPSIHNVYYRVHPEQDSNHATVLKQLIDESGLDTKDSTFTTAGSTLSADANFSVPKWGSDTIGPYTEYIQDILTSTLGYIFINRDFEIEYHLFSAPSSTDEITTTNYLDNTLSIEVDYNDIISKLTLYNEHTPTISTSSSTLENTKAMYLHGATKQLRTQHVLEDITGIDDDILGIRTNRRAKYLLEVRTKLTALIGDEFKIVSSDVLGGDGSISVVTLETERKEKGMFLILTDLLGV